MKNKILSYIIIIGIFSFDSFAQKEKISSVDKKTKSTQKSQVVRKIKSYQVEENIKMNFGGYTTTYNVSDSSLINTNDLGPNNTRVVTPKFVEAKRLMEPHKETMKDVLKQSLKPSNLKPRDSLQRQTGVASVVMIETYERVAEKGYKSVDIFQKLGNAFYFNNELDKAARWYGELFSISFDLAPEYYYRYSASLKAIGENDKANEMLARFNKLSGNSTSK
jgi:tetratricopeptide (TPR) repeat protein